MSIETPDGVLDVTNATLRVPQIEVQGTSVTTSLSTLSNVGVGTGTPGGRLHVYGPDAKTLLQSTSNTANVEIGGPSGAIVDLKGPFTDDYDLRIQSLGDGGTIATTGNVNHIRLASTGGYTGFGTATPQYKIDVQGVKGVDAVSNPIAHNPVFLYDDQESTTTFSGTAGGDGASRNTTSKYLELNSLTDNATGYVYWPVHMPNSWTAEFDHYIAGGDGGESLSFSFFNTSAPTTTGNHGGYRLAIAEFYGGSPAAKVVLYYQGSEVAQKNIVGGIPTSSWNKVVVNYNRGSISLSFNGRSAFSYEATENADSYTGRYSGFIGKTGLRNNYHRVRNVKCTSGTNWVYATGSNASTLAYLSGNVGIGTDAPTQMLEVTANVKATHFIGDGGLLSNIATTLNSIVNQGNTTSNTVQFTNEDTGIVATGNIVVQEGGFFVGDGSKLVNIPTDFESIIINGNTTSNVVFFANTNVAIQASGNIVVDSDSFFIGNGGLLSNIATTLEDISNQGNTTSNTIQFTNSSIGFVTTANVGIANSAPTNHLSVGSNLHVNDTGSNVLTVRGNVSANTLTLGDFQVVASYGLNHVTAENNTTNDTIVLTNTTTGLGVTSNIDVGGQLNLSNATTCIDASSNIELGGRLRFDSNVFVDTLRVADLAANLVTYEQSTGELLDSGGLFLNKIAVVSEQPAGVLTANSTTVTNHGTYKLTTSNLASGSNTWNAFDGSTSVAWTGSSSYTGASNVYAGSVRLASSTGSGEWLSIELPYKATVRHMKLTPASVASYPSTANLYATNDNITWTLLKEWSDVTPASASDVQTVKVNASAAYKRYVIVTTKVAGNSAEVAIGEWKLFTESFAIDGGKVEMASAAITGGNTVVDQTGPHARASPPLRKYPEIVFTEGEFEGNDTTNTYTQGGYTVSTSGFLNASYGPIEAFDEKLGSLSYWVSKESYNSSTGVYNKSPATTTTETSNTWTGEWLQVQFPNKIKLSDVLVNREYYAAQDLWGPDRIPKTGAIVASNDGTTWKYIHSWSGLTSSNFPGDGYGKLGTFTVNEFYKYYRFIVTATGGGGNGEFASIGQIKYYGYEETSDPDTSVDTTITSQFNLPDTTGVKLYIDGDKGSTPTDYSGEGHTLTDNSESFSGNAWSFSSLATSNVTMSTGDLAMEGTHPHSVSLWFNAANVSSNATLFHVGTAAGEGDAKTAISLTESGHLGWIDGGDNQFLSSNTWHNLVYATQGGGGLRTCYLDGRKLGDAQVQDTFGEYPPFAMTDYSQYGYTVSASSETSSSWQAWEAFDGTTPATSAWLSSVGKYNTTSPYLAIVGTAANLGTDSGGNATNHGEYLKIDMGHKLKLDYISINANRYTGVQAFSFYGSNDDVNWELLIDDTLPASLEYENSDFYNFTSNKNKSYKYFALVAKSTRSESSDHDYVGVTELKLYGHKENDTTRFPVSSTVLKYPHIQNTGGGDAIRGYVFSSSSGSASTPGFAFDGSYNAIGGNWLSSSGTFSSGVALSTETFGGSGSTINGPWLKVEMTNKILPTKLNMFVRESTNNNPRQPRSGIIYGSVDNSSWTNIGSFSYTNQTLPGDSTPNEITLTPSPSGTYYKYFLLHVTQMMTAKGLSDRVSITGMEFYGTEPEDVIARVGEGLDGKVANFRVYDKYLHEEQALELWDAQKDQFGRATSSVVVHKGRLGVGTTEPEGRFAVLDEAHAPEEFPPRAMTDYETYMEGHGVFRVSASSFIDISVIGGAFTQNIYPWYAFNKTSTYGWLSTSSVYSNGLADSDSANRFGIRGEWLQIEMPSKIKLKHFTLSLNYDEVNPSGTNTSRFPKVFNLYKSNDGVTWTTAMEITTPTAPSEGAYGTTYTYNINESEYYNRYLIQVKQTHSNTSGYTNPSSHTAIGEWRLFGTREQGQSVLHDGQLTLTKNLTVPRIGPALDADDTPRRDRLVVEYNTSTNPTANGTVKDTSRSRLDGLMYNGAYYDATEKALVFDGTDDYVYTGNIGNPAGAYVHSASFWVKPDKMSSGVIFMQLGKGADAAAKRLQVFMSTTNEISFGLNGSNTKFASTGINAGSWFHIAYSYDGGLGGASSTAYKLYVNGVSITGPTSGVNTVALNLDSNAVLAIGATHLGTGDFFDGQISNFKLYDTALTADEVKRLYDMGRCDEGHHVVNFSKTRVGIGLGDGEAPQAALEVRDVARFHQIDIHHDTETDTVINFRHYLGSAVKPWEIGQIMGVNPTGANNSDFKFATNRVVKAWIDSSSAAPTVEINNFTGQHRTFIKDVPFSKANELEGLIVSSDQNKYIKMSGGIEVGSNAITTNESLPVVSLSNVVADKRCFGVISASEDPETRQDRYGNIVSVSVKEVGDTRVYINSVGEGAMWVTDINGPLESGDYITTSNVAGYGQKQDSEFLANYTVAKITMDCDFDPQDQPIQRIKQSNVVETHYMGMVSVTRGVPHEFVTTTVTADDEWSNVSISPSDVTYEEWSNLEANVQNTYTLTYTQTSNVVYDVKYTKTTTANVTQSDPWDKVYVDPPNVSYEEWSNLDANVQNTYTLTYTMTTKVEATEAIYSNLSTEDKEFFVPTYYQMVEQRVNAEYPGAVKHETITDRLENALDEHGQLQWEDDPSGATEKAYKIRYLDASGAQTDEANAVHTAAFVGVTYHCG
jgi:hypothetical protein